MRGLATGRGHQRARHIAPFSQRRRRRLAISAETLACRRAPPRSSWRRRLGMLKASQPALQARDRPGVFNHAAHGSWLSSPRSTPAAKHRRIVASGAATDRGPQRARPRQQHREADDDEERRRRQPQSQQQGAQSAQVPVPPGSPPHPAAESFHEHKDGSGNIFFRKDPQLAATPTSRQPEISRWLDPVVQPAADREVLVSQLRERARLLLSCVAERDILVRERDAEIASLKTELAQNISIASQREVRTKTKRDTEEELEAMVGRERAAMKAEHEALHAEHGAEMARLEGLIAGAGKRSLLAPFSSVSKRSFAKTGSGKT